MLLVLVVLVVLLLSINVHGLLPVSTSYYTQKNRVSYKISSVNRANTYGNGPLSSIVSCTSTAARTVTIRTIVTAATKRSVSTTALLLSRCDEYADFVTKPRWGGRIVGPVLRYLNDFAVGIIFTVVMRIMNKFRSHRREALLNAIFKRPKGQGLLTVSNHQSFFDDPGIWAAVLPWWRIRPDRLRWSLCTEDVFFYNKALQSVLAAGNVVPLDRSGSLEQPMFERFKDKVSNGSWCHIFSEGKIRQNWRFEDNEPKLSVFKPGIGKIIAHSKVCPVVLPIYHKNMDKIIPEVVLPDTKTKKPSKPVSIVPRGGNEIDLYIGEPLDFTKKVEQFKLKHPNMLNQWRSTAETIELYCEITNEIRNKVLLLEAEAYGREIAASKDIALA